MQGAEHEGGVKTYVVDVHAWLRRYLLELVQCTITLQGHKRKCCKAILRSEE